MTPLISGSARPGRQERRRRTGRLGRSADGSWAEHHGQRGVASVIVRTLLARIPASSLTRLVLPRHSHSIVAGGLLLMS